MIPIYNSIQIKEIDQYTIKHKPITSTKLMEHASKMFCKEFEKLYKKNFKINIICGTGNNGGDGLVIAKILSKKNYTVSVFIVGNIKDATDEFNYQLKKLQIEPKIINTEQDFPTERIYTVYIDGIFGIGLNKPVAKIQKQIIEHLNSLDADIVSIDIASGLFSNKNTSNKIIAIKPKYTISFQYPKHSFFQPTMNIFVGKWKNIDIGLLNKHIPFDECLIETKDIFKILPYRPRYSHKGTFGQALIIAGQTNMSGAAILSTKSCFRSGVGKVEVITPNQCQYALQVSVPEAIVAKQKFSEIIENINLKNKHYNAIGIGPGIGTSDKTISCVLQFIREQNQPIIIDADCINIIAKNPTILKNIPKQSILTPHPLELERLIGNWENDDDKIQKIKDFCEIHQLFIVLKGFHTLICTHQRKIYYNSTGNSGMATAGSGDVLLGLITGLLAQTNHPLHSILIGVFIHGLSGEIASEKSSEYSTIASDISNNIGKAYKKIIKNKNINLPIKTDYYY